MQNRHYLFLLATFLLTVYCTDAMSARHERVRLQKRDANPGVNYDDDVMADAAGDEALNDADGGDDDEDVEDNENASITNFPEHFVLAVGRTVRLPCTVNMNGVVIEWQKDGQLMYMGTIKLDSVPDTVDRDKNDLIISDLKVADSGSYTCKIPGTTNMVTHTLGVNAETGAAIQNMTVTDNGIVIEGTDVRVTCHATGVPPPTLIWSREMEAGNTKLTEKDVEFVGDSIVIKNIKPHHSGRYLCYAENNNRTRPAAHQVTIKVLSKPYVHVHKMVINSKLGITAVLQCTVHHEPLANIKWFKNGMEVVTASENLFIHTVGQHSNLTVTPKTEEDFGNYSCMAENSQGKHEKTVSLIQDPVIEDLDVNGDEISWTVHSHLPLQEVEIQLKQVDLDEPWQTISVPIAEGQSVVYHMKYKLQDFEVGKYEANIRAKNHHSWGDRSEVFYPNIAPEPEKVVRSSVFGGNGQEAIRPTSVIVSTVLSYILMRFL